MRALITGRQPKDTHLEPAPLEVIETPIPGILIGQLAPIQPEPEDRELGWTTTDEGEEW